MSEGEDDRTRQWLNKLTEEIVARAEREKNSQSQWRRDVQTLLAEILAELKAIREQG